MTVRFIAARENIEAYREIENIGGGTRRAIRQTWFRLGADLRKEAKAEILRKPKGGRTYYIRMRGGAVRRHVSSAPGETHANLTGALRRSISWKVHGTESMEFGYGFSTTERNKAPPYDAAIEFGTEDGKIKPRPSIANAIKVVEGRVEDHFQAEMAKEFKPS